MKKLDINITKAQLESFSLTLNEKPVINASLGLYTEGGKKITTYAASSNAWDETKKLEIPLEAHALLAKAAKLIEASIVKHCRDSQGMLGSGDDMPIDLSEIPF